MSETHTTPLLALLRECSPDERQQLATLAGTTVNYLYSLAGCHRAMPNAKLALDIEDASRKLHESTSCRTPIVTVRELATMCSLQGLTG